MSTAARGSVIEIEKLIQEAESMPPLPYSVVRLAALVAEPDVDLRRVAEVIEFDQALVLALLRVANSAATAPRMPVVSLLDAITRLGTSAVLDIAGESGQLAEPVPSYGLDEGEMWNHSVLATIAGEVIRMNATVRLPPETATAALLHDFGKIVLCRHLNEDIVRLLKEAERAERCSAWEAEFAVLETHHGEIGGLVLQAWNLPAPIVDAVINHHTPERGADEFACAVALCDLIANDLAYGPGRRFLVPGATIITAQLTLTEIAHRDEWMDALGMSSELYDELLEVTAQRFQTVSIRLQNS